MPLRLVIQDYPRGITRNRKKSVQRASKFDPFANGKSRPDIRIWLSISPRVPPNLNEPAERFAASEICEASKCRGSSRGLSG